MTDKQLHNFIATTDQQEAYLVEMLAHMTETGNVGNFAEIIGTLAAEPNRPTEVKTMPWAIARAVAQFAVYGFNRANIILAERDEDEKKKQA